MSHAQQRPAHSTSSRPSSPGRVRDKGASRRDLEGPDAGLLGLLSLLVFGRRNLLRRGFPKHLGKGLQHSGLPNGVIVDRFRRLPQRFAFRPFSSPACSSGAGTSPRPWRSARRSGHTRQTYFLYLGIARTSHGLFTNPSDSWDVRASCGAEAPVSAFTSSPRQYAFSTAWVGNNIRTCRTAFVPTRSFSGPIDVRAIGNWGLNFPTRRITIRRQSMDPVVT